MTAGGYGWNALDPSEPLFAAPRITSEDDADGVLRHRDERGREYRVAEVDGQLTYELIEDER